LRVPDLDRITALKRVWTVEARLESEESCSRWASGSDCDGNYEQSGPRSGRKTAGRAAAGSLVGFALGGPAAGAAIGAATGLIDQGKSVDAPPGTLLEFRLTRVVTL
jgi:hypothetical protein